MRNSGEEGQDADGGYINCEQKHRKRTLSGFKYVKEIFPFCGK